MILGEKRAGVTRRFSYVWPLWPGRTPGRLFKGAPDRAGLILAPHDLPGRVLRTEKLKRSLPVQEAAILPQEQGLPLRKNQLRASPGQYLCHDTAASRFPACKSPVRLLSPETQGKGPACVFFSLFLFFLTADLPGCRQIGSLVLHEKCHCADFLLEGAIGPHTHKIEKKNRRENPGLQNPFHSSILTLLSFSTALSEDTMISWEGERVPS